MDDVGRKAPLDRARRFEYLATIFAVAAATGSAATQHWVWFAIDAPVALLLS